MSFTFVFYRSLGLTLIVGLFLLAACPRSRRFPVLMSAIIGVLSIHTIWIFLPDLPGFAGEAGRWLVSAWVASVVTATLLIVPLTLLMLAKRALRRSVSLSAPLALGSLGICLLVGFAVSVETVRGPVVRESIVVVPGLPAGLSGLRIANIGDVHIGRFMAPKDLADAVSIVNSLNVDLLMLTGDLIDDLALLDPTLDALELSKATPVLSILGNHDKYPNETAVVSALRSRGTRIQVLINSSVIVEPRGIPIRIAGVDYPLATDGRHMIPRDEQDAMMASFAKKAFAEAVPGETLITLAHHPEFFPFAAANGSSLTLSAHTHGGQVKLFGRPLIVAYDYMHGIYHQDGKFLDVTSGLGHWLPLRIGVPREISVVTLKSS